MESSERWGAPRAQKLIAVDQELLEGFNVVEPLEGPEGSGGCPNNQDVVVGQTSTNAARAEI